MTNRNQTVKLIADLGKGNPFDAGHCHPSQARILVKKKLAEWKDGKLLVRLRPVHLAVAAHTFALPEEEHHISEAEMERRQNWFREIVGAVMDSDTREPDLGKILRYHSEEGARTVGSREILQDILEAGTRMQEEIDTRLTWSRTGSSEPDDDAWFDPDVEPPISTSLKEMIAMWLGLTVEEMAEAHGDDFGEDPPRTTASTSFAQDTSVYTPVYTPEDVEDDGIVLLRVPFRKMGRPDEVRKRDGTWGEKDATFRRCPTCGQGEDTDGDGGCPLCRSHLKIPVR